MFSFHTFVGVEEQVHLQDNGNGTYVARYTASKEGTYQVSVNYNNEAVAKSPFKVRVQPKYDATKVKCDGPGLANSGVPASLPVQFTIDAKEAGEGLLAVQITVS